MATMRGRIVYIYPTEQKTSKEGKAYKQRDFVIALQKVNTETGAVEIDETNTPLLSVFGRRCDYIGSIPVGNMVDITYEIHGSRYRGSDGKERIQTHVRVTNVQMLKRDNPWADINRGC